VSVTPLAARSPAAVRDALVRRGIDTAHAEAASRGLAPVALVLEGLCADARGAVAAAAARLGIEAWSGADWILLAGSAARLGRMTRPGRGPLPAEIREELRRFLAGVMAPPAQWATARGGIPLDRPLVVAILNVTPDSFSDGGRYLDPDAALCHAAALLEGGADMLDIGAESTRPGRPAPVSAEEEWRRLEPVLEELVRRFPHVPLSVDTVKGETARRGLEAGAWAINDVSALRLDPAVADACAAHGAGLVLMHSRGTVEDMASYDRARYHDVVAEMVAELRAAVDCATAREVPPERLVLDPGLGFSKTPEQSWEALRGLPALAALGFPVMVGPSRKRFLGVVAGSEPAARDRATAAACVAAYFLGASLFRVHDAGLAREALDVARAAGGA
jgi:dihydropteroate synthase